MPDLSLRLLGGLELRGITGAQAALPTRKAEALLGYLAYTAGQWHRREKLAALLWDGSAHEQARNSLRQTLFILRRALGPSADSTLRVDADAICLDPSDIHVDVAQFDRLTATAEPAALAEAMHLYRGDLLAGFTVTEPFDEWAAGERELIRARAAGALGQLVAYHTGRGAMESAIEWGARLVALEPLHEAAHRQLMRLYVKAEQPAAALRQYHACKDALAKELGVAPEPLTTRLYDEIGRQRERGAAAAMEEEAPPATILIVEDETVTRTLIEEFLIRGGYTVVTAANGETALAILGERKVDLMVADIRLPDIDGFQLFGTLRSRDLAIPTVFLTALRGQTAEAKGLALGAADFIRKPVQKDILLLRVRNVLQRARHATALSGSR